MRNSLASTLLVLPCVWFLSGFPAAAQDEPVTLRANLSGFQEVPPKLTNGHGEFHATINADRSSIAYEVSFADLTSDVLVAHIHFGQRGVNGGVFVFLCGGGNKPACPAGGGSVSGTIVASDILAPDPDQGITAGSLQDAIRILLSGKTYVNVHTTRFPAGEIRGQVKTGKRDKQDEKKDRDDREK